MSGRRVKLQKRAEERARSYATALRRIAHGNHKPGEARLIAAEALKDMILL